MMITKRKKDILKAIVEDYIDTAEPVGSKALVERRELGLSPATVRSEMADLENMGYLEQPHASAGRVPSPRGYRLYVNDLMESRTLSPDEKEPLNRLLDRRIADLDRMLSRAGKLLSRLTGCASLTMTSSEGNVRFSRFELFLSDPHSLVCVAVTDSGVVKSKMIRLSREGDDAQARQLAVALNTVLTSGDPNGYMTDRQLDEVACIAGAGSRYLPAVTEFLRECVAQLAEREVFVSGTSHLLEQPEFRDTDRARGLLQFLSEGDEVSRLAAPAPGAEPKVLIGPENALAELKDSSVVLASVPMGDGLSGLIGMVGPTRMDYGKLMAHLNYFASRMGGFDGEK